MISLNFKVFIDMDGSREELQLTWEGKTVAFAKVGAIFVCSKRHRFGLKLCTLSRKKPQRVFVLPKQSNSAVKVLMIIIRTGIDMTALPQVYSLYKQFLFQSHTHRSILRQLSNSVKILSLALYCAGAVRNFWLWQTKQIRTNWLVPVNNAKWTNQ